MMKKGLLAQWQPIGSLELWLLVAIALATLIRIVNLATHEFWYDEVLSLLLSTGQRTAYEHPEMVPVALSNYAPLLNLPQETSLTDVLQTIKNLLKGVVGGEPHPPLFFLGQHLWLRLFGNDVAQVRSLGVLLSLVTIGSSYGLGRLVLGHRGGLLLTALLATNPFYCFHSLNLRMYGPLVLWVTLSGWAMLHLIEQAKQQDADGKRYIPLQSQIFWNLLLIGSLAAGFLTFYPFVFWSTSLLVLALYLDRQRWWLHIIRVGASVTLTMPWILWGTVQQMRNADLDRFSQPLSAAETAIRHLQGVMQAFGVPLGMGDWATSLPEAAIFPTGLVILLLLLACAIGLWRQGDRQILGIALILGFLPLGLALSADVASSKFTLGWGYSRSVIFILPGCLLLVAAGLRQAKRWQQGATAVVLLLYLSLSFGNFTFRHRQIFHTVNAQLQQQPNTPTLIAMNSKAWGHVLRLAYYTDPALPVKLLATSPDELAPALQQVLGSGAQFDRILWLDPARAVWNEPETDAEQEQIHQAIQQVLQADYRLATTQSLSGTMDLDQFALHLYEHAPI